MRVHRAATIVALSLLGGTVLGAQHAPAVRSIGRVERVSTEPLTSIATALQLSDGRVYVNDMTGHRVLLFDSTLSKPKVIADTTSATAKAYGKRAGTLIRFRGDTALFIDPSSLSMLALNPTGDVARVMAIPRPEQAQFLIGGIFGTPAFDPRGRLTYYAPAGALGFPQLCCLGALTVKPTDPMASFLRTLSHQPDSAFVVSVNLDTRTLDTIAAFKVPVTKVSYNSDGQSVITSFEATTNPLPIVDAWAIASDGRLAIVRGREYRVDWIDGAHRVTTGPKLPFSWQRLDDDRKMAIIDSTTKVEEASLPTGGASGGGAAASDGRGSSPGGGAAGGTRIRQPIPVVIGRPKAADLPDYVPPFTRGAVLADGDGNIWVRTTTLVHGQPVYDIIDPKGELMDRVQLPPFRSIVGFAPGVVYMAVKSATGNVHLERARVR